MEPYVVDARRCISYLTIELKGSIPIEFRKPMGNRIYGCDDCQLYCPWNRFAHASSEPDFAPREQLDNSRLVELFQWDEVTFNHRLEGSAIRFQGGEEIPVKKGDFWRTPGGVPHTMRAGPEGCRVLDIFSPPRAEYKKAGKGFGTG